MNAIKFFRETALPGSLQPYSVYFIAPTAKPNYTEIYVTNSDGSAVRRVINSDDVQAMINAAIAAQSQLPVS